MKTERIFANLLRIEEKMRILKNCIFGFTAKKRIIKNVKIQNFISPF